MDNSQRGVERTMKAETNVQTSPTTPKRPSSVRSDDWFDDDWEDYEYAEEAVN